MNEKQPNLDGAQLEALLKITSQRLGTTPEQLKQAAQNGSLSGLVGQNEGAALQKVLNDPEAAKKLLSSPQAQKLFQMLQKGNK
ncbi:MAG: hypothetical protein J1E06_11740 [Acutalibacter sp.]|nr:hypothetical protein [Acutalibacter sp.]